MKHLAQRTLISCILLLCGAGFAIGQTIMTVDDVSVYALEHSRAIGAAVKSLDDAREELGFSFSLEDSSLTLSGGYDYTPPPLPENGREHGFGINSNVVVPIIPEVSLSAGLNYGFREGENPSGSFGVVYSPFAGTSTEWRDWENLRKAEITLDELYNTVPMNAEGAALDLIRGQLNIQSALRSMELEEQKYEIAQKRFELQDMTFSELEDARSDLGTARQKYYDSQKGLLSLKKSLYQIIGPDLGDIDIHELAVDEVLLMVASREQELSNLKEKSPATVTLLNSAVELEALNKQLDATPVFKPTLSVSATVNYNTFKAGTSVSIKVSPNQFQTEERADIVELIEDKKLDLALEQATLSLEISMLEQSIAVAKEALDISMNDYENAQIQSNETEYLHKLGERTDVELAESELSVFSSQIGLFTSATDLYKTLGDLLLLYRNG